MASGKRASMREGPLADLFRKTEEAADAADQTREESGSDRMPAPSTHAAQERPAPSAPRAQGPPPPSPPPPPARRGLPAPRADPPGGGPPRRARAARAHAA